MANSIQDALSIVDVIFSKSLYSRPFSVHFKRNLLIPLYFFILLEWLMKDHENCLHNFSKKKHLNHFTYIAIVLLIFGFA